MTIKLEHFKVYSLKVPILIDPHDSGNIVVLNLNV